MAGTSSLIPADLAPILDRLQLSRETWVETVQHVGKWFHRGAGGSETLPSTANGSAAFRTVA